MLLKRVIKPLLLLLQLLFTIIYGTLGNGIFQYKVFNESSKQRVPCFNNSNVRQILASC